MVDAPVVVGTIPVGNGPLGIGVDPLRGRAYVANGTNGSVSIIDVAAGVVSATLPVGRLPIAFGAFIGAIANACPVPGAGLRRRQPRDARRVRDPGDLCRHTLDLGRGTRGPLRNPS